MFKTEWNEMSFDFCVNSWIYDTWRFKNNSFLGPKSTKMLKVNSVTVFLLISLSFDPINAGKFLPQTHLSVCMMLLSNNNDLKQTTYANRRYV